jgi:hypothetical protein
VLIEEYSANLESITDVLSHPASRKGIQDGALSALLEEIKIQISYPHVELFKQMTKRIADYCSAHSEVLKAGAAEEKDAFREMYRKKVFGRKVLLLFDVDKAHIQANMQALRPIRKANKKVENLRIRL